MPVTIAGATPVIYTGLLTVGNIGTGTPKLSAAIASGLSRWVATIQVSTVDTGTLGVGVGILPLIVPPPVMIPFFLSSFASFKILGILAPLFITGLSNGLSLALIQGIIQTNHPSVGLGAAVAMLSAPPAGPVFAQAFSEMGLLGDGPLKMANAIGQGLDSVLKVLIYPVPIVGPPNIVPSAGSGTGKIL